eukprot:scaffold29544_cov27-Prasinocladus_malaysianus.AAC.1
MRRTGTRTRFSTDSCGGKLCANLYSYRTRPVYRSVKGSNYEYEYEYSKSNRSATRISISQESEKSDPRWIARHSRHLVSLLEGERERVATIASQKQRQGKGQTGDSPLRTGLASGG